MLHGIESRLQRTNFGFICNFTLAERGRKRQRHVRVEGGQRFGGIFGNQSLDVIIGHINSALARQLHILKSNVPPTATGGQLRLRLRLQLRLRLHLRPQLRLGSDWIDCDRLVSGISNYPKATARLAARRTDGQLNCQSFCHSFNCSWHRAKRTNGKLATVAKQTDTETGSGERGNGAAYESAMALPAGFGKPEILDIMTPFSVGHVNNGRLTNSSGGSAASLSRQ